MKPNKPIIRTPNADIFAIDLNSSLVGFLSICHTLAHWKKNDFIFSVVAMKEIVFGDF